MSHSSTVADDSDDSLNLGAAERSKTRIADDGRATQRLKADHKGGESSKAANSDMETESIDEFPSQPKKRGKVHSMVRNLERNGGKLHPPKLPLTSSNPLSLLPPNHKPKVRLTEEEGLLTNILVPGKV